MYICMCIIKQLAIKTKHFHWCWYFSTDQWICNGGYFIWVVVSADNCWPHPCVCVFVCVCVCVVTGLSQSEPHTSGKNSTSVAFVKIYVEIWINGTDVRHSQRFKSNNLLITYKCFWMCFGYANNYHSSLLTLHIRLVSMFIMWNITTVVYWCL